jgi:putative DNA primase/helicase
MAPEPRPLSILLADDPPGPADDDPGDGDARHRAGQNLAAHQFARRKGDVVRFDHATGDWIIWTGSRWRRDDDGAIRRIWDSVLRDRCDDAWGQAPDARSSAIQAILKAGSTDAQIAGGLRIAASMPSITTNGSSWDADPDVIGTANGMIVDLRTGDARLAAPDDMVTKATAVAWDGIDARAPRWEAFLTETHPDDAELVDWLQRLFGASLVGRSIELLPIHHGAGSNGKSVALTTIARILGDYATTIPVSALIDARRRAGQATPDLMLLRGSRFAMSSESRVDDQLDDGAVKMLASMDPLSGRYLHRDQVSWDPTHTLHLGTNHLPTVADPSDGLWRRIALVPWLVRFRAPGDPGDGPLRDDGLAANLRSAEGPGILAWLVQGAIGYHRRGLFPLPVSVRVPTAEYRKESDPLDFLDGRLIIDPAAFTTSGELAAAYRLATGEEIDARRLGRIVKPHLLAMGATYDRLGVDRGYSGVRLLRADDVR